MKPLLITGGKDRWQQRYAVQVYARGKWCWLTNGFKIIKHKTVEAADRERAEMRKRRDPGLAAIAKATGEA